jgi:hypothetical protein
MTCLQAKQEIGFRKKPANLGEELPTAGWRSELHPLF